CVERRRSSSMESCIAVPGNTRPCWLHSKQRAQHRDALEVLRNGAERQSGGATHGEHKQHTARGTSGGLASPPLWGMEGHLPDPASVDTDRGQSPNGTLPLSQPLVACHLVCHPARPDHLCHSLSRRH